MAGRPPRPPARPVTPPAYSAPINNDTRTTDHRLPPTVRRSPTTDHRPPPTARRPPRDPPPRQAERIACDARPTPGNEAAFSRDRDAGIEDALARCLCSLSDQRQRAGRERKTERQERAGERGGRGEEGREERRTGSREERGRVRRRERERG